MPNFPTRNLKIMFLSYLTISLQETITVTSSKKATIQNPKNKRRSHVGSWQLHTKLAASGAASTSSRPATPAIIILAYLFPRLMSSPERCSNMQGKMAYNLRQIFFVFSCFDYFGEGRLLLVLHIHYNPLLSRRPKYNHGFKFAVDVSCHGAGAGVVKINFGALACNWPGFFADKSYLES